MILHTYVYVQLLYVCTYVITIWRETLVAEKFGKFTENTFGERKFGDLLPLNKYTL